MNLSLIRSMTRSAVFELENGLCFRPAHPFVVTLNGKTVYEACNTNVFSLFSLLPGTEYTVGVQAEGETLSLTFVTEAETFFVDASRYGLVADGETDNTGKLQAALSTCPKGGTVYVPAGRYQHLPVNGKVCRAAGRQRPHPLHHPARRTAQRERGGRVLPDRLGGQPAEQLCRPAEHHPGARRRGHR